jgi:hypothetical protein
MRIKVVSYTVAAICTAAILHGCSAQKQSDETATTPKLIPYRIKAERDAGGSTDNAPEGDDMVHAAPTTANVNGELISIGDRVWNDGVPFDGLRLVVSGGAFSTGLLGPPEQCHIEVRSKDKIDQIGATAAADFKQTQPNVYTAIVPTVHCTDSIAFNWNAPALKAGAADYQVSIAPVDGSCRAINFAHPCVVDAALNIRSAPTATPPG